MKKLVTTLAAAGAMTALSFSAAKAQSVDTLTSIPGVGDVVAILVASDPSAGGDSSLSLLDPNSVPVVGSIVGVLLDTGGVDGLTSLTTLADTSSIPVIGTLIGGSDTGGAEGLFGAIPVVGPSLEPLGAPLFAALNPDALSGGSSSGGAGFSPEEGFAIGVNLSNLANDPANGILYGSPDDVNIHSQTLGIALLDEAVVDVSVLGDIAAAGLPVGAVPGLEALGPLTDIAGADGEGFQLTVNLLAAQADPTSLIGYGPAGTQDIHHSTVGLELLGPSLLDVALLGDVLAVAGAGGMGGAGGDSPLSALPVGSLPLDSIPVLGEVLGGVLGGQ